MGEGTVASLVGLAVMAAGCAVVFVVAKKGGDGTLARNPWAGIRTATTMTDDETWAAAHRAGARPMMLGAAAGGVGVLLGIVLAVLRPELAVVGVLAGAAGLLAGAVGGGLAGQKAAKAVLDEGTRRS